MKQFLAMLLLVALVFTVACAPKQAETPTETPAEQPSGQATIVDEENLTAKDVKAITIGLVTDTGGIDDKSFNQGTWEGIKAYAAKFELPEANYSFLQSRSDADYIQNLSQFADDKKDLLVAPGFLFETAIKEISTNYPEQKILFIDAVVDAPNVANAVFAEEEGSFLVGVAAALKSKEAGKSKVGFIGGMDFALIQKFEAGFEQGVKAVDPNMEIVIQYASGFDKPEEGQTIAAKMYDEGVYVIYHAAGATGNGAIKEARERRAKNEDVWVIGVDKDQYNDGIYEGDKSAVLTSMVKRVDQASYDISKMVAKGEFKGGMYVYTLKNNGVGIPASNPNLTADWIAKIKEYSDKIKNGEIKVDPVPARVK